VKRMWRRLVALIGVGVFVVVFQYAASMAPAESIYSAAVPGYAVDVRLVASPTPTLTPTPTPIPTPTPVPTPYVPHDRVLTEVELVYLLRSTGWAEHVIAPATRVAWGESSWRPWIINSIGCCYGLFQLHAGTWAPYCGVTKQALLDPWVNASCAWKVYNYDLSKGYAPWTQWEVKP
jgi:hypothetical protein